MDTPKLLSIDSFADAIDTSRSQVYRLMAAGLLKFVVVGSDRRIPSSELERLMNEGAPNGKKNVVIPGPGRGKKSAKRDLVGG